MCGGLHEVGVYRRVGGYAVENVDKKALVIYSLLLIGDNSGQEPGFCGDCGYKAAVLTSFITSDIL